MKLTSIKMIVTACALIAAVVGFVIVKPGLQKSAAGTADNPTSSDPMAGFFGRWTVDVDATMQEMAGQSQFAGMDDTAKREHIEKYMMIDVEFTPTEQIIHSRGGADVNQFDVVESNGDSTVIRERVNQSNPDKTRPLVTLKRVGARMNIQIEDMDMFDVCIWQRVE